MNADARLYLEIAVWSQIVSSIVFIGVLVYMWFKWLLPVFLAAQERSNRQIAEAERHRDEVKGAVEALHREIESANRDAGLIIARAGEHAEHERQATVAEANDAGERSLDNARKELDRARAAARRRLRSEMLDQALRLARHDAAERVTAALDSRLVEQFTGSLQTVTHD